MKKLILAALLASGVANAGEFDGAYLCTAENKTVGTFYQVITSNQTGSLIVAACVGDCRIAGYMIGTISNGTFTGTTESLLKLSFPISAAGYTFTDTYTGFGASAITSRVSCSKIW